ncbi:Glutamate racemase (chromatophore) [Paulinella micropora]|uniref:glutamate racemase n=1 Tax=Paulinella micropora TaxID=1928728 RepID=A0A1L5YCK3_9EUKA|nr:glutamate racemase [Paulinella micropora]AQX45212.1 Glutamate racemase [Paulinella micropora]BBL86431.1 Glutamate racemase [Paulinella micropora]
MNQVKLGLFDSGVGGLTVLYQLLKRHPNQHCIYLADTARVPYGQRDASEIRSIAGEAICWLRQQKIDALVMACNTTNAVAYDVAVRLADAPVYGLIDSAARCIQAKRVGVLATAATVSSRAYTLQIHRYSCCTEVIEQACPDFVPLIEKGNLQDPQILLSARSYLAPLLAANVETIVLGCTHYPILEPLLRQLLPSHVNLVNPACALSRRLDQIFGSPTVKKAPFTNLTEKDLFFRSRFYVTDSSESFAEAATSYIGYKPRVELISLQSESRSI